ncbi:MAG: alpha/beta fold hydrolase [Thermoanaerobaculia bacterium]|nr:alpha/beta fold hydrolase [Thermoanaerobaculia bacterium]
MPTRTLVLLPGMDGTGELFAPFVAELGTAFDVKVVRYPDDPAAGYPELEEVVRQALPLEGPVALLGESFSGPIAIRLASELGERLEALILCATFARDPLPIGTGLGALLAVLPPRLVPGRLLSWFLLGDRQTLALRSSLGQALAQLSLATLRSWLRAVRRVDATAALATIRAPVLYLRAAQDRLVPAKAGELVGSICPQAKLVTLDAPHLLLQTAPREAAWLVEECLRP